MSLVDQMKAAAIEQREKLNATLYKQGKGTWAPLQSRFKVELVHESLSDVIEVSTADTKKHDHYVKARIVALGPQTGYDMEKVDGKIVKVKVYDFKLGDIIIINQSHLIKYKDPGDSNKLHLFIKDEQSAVALWQSDKQ